MISRPPIVRQHRSNPAFDQRLHQLDLQATGPGGTDALRTLVDITLPGPYLHPAPILASARARGKDHSSHTASRGDSCSAVNLPRLTAGFGITATIDTFVCGIDIIEPAATGQDHRFILCAQARAVIPTADDMRLPDEGAYSGIVATAQALTLTR